MTWHKPISLYASERDSNLIYELDIERVPSSPGVYVFMRSFGHAMNPLYVGKASNLNSRIKQRLNTLYEVDEGNSRTLRMAHDFC